MVWRFALVAANALAGLAVVAGSPGDLASLGIALLIWLTAMALLGNPPKAWFRVPIMLLNGLLAVVAGLVLLAAWVFFEATFELPELLAPALPAVNCATLARLGR